MTELSTYLMLLIMTADKPYAITLVSAKALHQCALCPLF